MTAEQRPAVPESVGLGAEDPVPPSQTGELDSKSANSNSRPIAKSDDLHSLASAENEGQETTKQMSEGVSAPSPGGKVDSPSSEQVKSMAREKSISEQDLHHMSKPDISTEPVKSQSGAFDAPISTDDGTKVDSSVSPDGEHPSLESSLKETEASVNVSQEETPPLISRGIDGMGNEITQTQEAALPQIVPSALQREAETYVDTSSIREEIPAPEEEARIATKSSPAIENPPLSTSLPPMKKSKLKSFPTRKVKDDELKSKVLIPKYLVEGMKQAVESAGVVPNPIPRLSLPAPSTPILVFINSRSGGRLGSKLQEMLAKLIAPEQVYDLNEYKPPDVLRHGLGYLEKEAAAGDATALETRNNLRIMVAGGDGTVGWVLGSISELQLKDGFKVPPVGVIPLGTGNDLSRSFYWGGSTTSVRHSTIRRWLNRATEAGTSSLDSWQIVVKPAPTLMDAKLELPHSMHPQHHIPLEHSNGSGNNGDKSPYFEGSFWNYFSLGMDAQVAYGFHHLRNAAPWLASGRVSNQVVYGGYGCAQGWFCTPCATAPVARGLRQIATLSIRRINDVDGQFEKVLIPPNIRAIVILNLQSYAGGRNPWGHPSARRQQKNGFVEASYNDRVLEIIGLRDGWHSTLVLLDLFQAVRLCQAKDVRLELRGTARRKSAYMQIDGEPWQQPLGVDNEAPAIVELSCRPVQSICLSRK